MRHVIGNRRRRGVTVIMVLALLSLTLALSYAMLRTQTASRQIQQNVDRRAQARQAAMTGLMVGLRKMHEADWAGVDAPLTQSLQNEASYTVTYATGDALLTPAHADYAKWPYRVTVTSTGKVTEAGTGRIAALHTAQAVVELVPRALSSQPANWASLQNYTAYQWDNGSNVTCELPVRIEGPALLQGPLQLCESYPPIGRPWHGRIDEVVVLNRALSASEILSTYTSASAASLLLPIVYTSLSPTHWWRLNESSGAATAVNSGASSAAGKHANGAVSGATGISGNCTWFDGSDDYIDLGKLDVSGSALTMLAWIRAESWPGNRYSRIISKATGTDENDTYWMLGVAPVGNSQMLRMRVRAGGSTTTLVASSGALQTGQWYCVAGVYTGSAMILYVNGVEVGRASKSGSLATNSDAAVYLGDNPPGSPRTHYLKGLEAMRAAGLGDYRPFGGSLSLPAASNSAARLEMLQSHLGITPANVAAGTAAPLALPSVPKTYRLYPGGKEYVVEAVPAGTRSADLRPSVETNPLGIFHCNGTLTVGPGVTVEGTIFTSGKKPDLRIDGDKVSLRPATLPALYGGTAPVQLPAAIVADDLRIDARKSISISGVVFAARDFAFSGGTQSANCDFQGRLFARKLKLEARSEWTDTSQAQWDGELSEFVSQLGASGAVANFPQWMKKDRGLNYEPALTLRPPATSVVYHWPDWGQPIFAPHSSDPGLLWQLIRIDAR